MVQSIIFQCPKCGEELTLTADHFPGHAFRPPNMLSFSALCESIRHEGCGGYLLKSEAKFLRLDFRKPENREAQHQEDE